MAFPEKKLAELWVKYDGDPERLEKIADRFGWTVQQAYIATDHLAKRDLMAAGIIHGN
jgi:hypothetical protein